MIALSLHIKHEYDRELSHFSLSYAQYLRNEVG